MHRARLRKVGGSIMLAIPPAILELLQLNAGSTVDVDVVGNRLIVESKARSRYSLAELLAECDPGQPISSAERDWLDTKPAGDELL